MEGKRKGLGLGLGVSKGRSDHLKRSSSKNMTKTKTKKKRSFLTIRGIVKYLKSDSYFYSSLFSASSSHVSSPGLETEEPLLTNDGNLREKVVEYLKSDTYLYAPLEYTLPSDHLAVISSRKGQELLFKKVNDKFSSKETSSRARRVAEESLGEMRGDHNSKVIPGEGIDVTPNTPELLEVKRKVIHRSYHTRFSTISGNKLQE